MGEVYKAHDQKLGRDVAIKVIPNALALDPEHVGRFRREARLLASQNHPNIASIYALEEFSGKQYLVMELVEGDTLAEYLKRTGAVPLDEALRLCSQIADALEAAHSRRVTHRDVKPANIKITPEGRIKLLDFGLAKIAPMDDQHLPGAAVTTAVTEHGRILGTPAYMSPEQVRGKPADLRTDIWALGCVLFELLASKRPFQGATVSDTMAAILEREPNYGLLPPATPPQVKNLIRGCLAKNAELRYQSMAEVRAALGSIVSRRGSRGLRARWIAAIALAATLASAAVFVPGMRRAAADLVRLNSIPAEKHLAVLPFLNVGNDPMNQVFCDGLIESLTSNLTQLQRFQDTLFVVPSSEVRRQAITSPSEAHRTFAANLAVTGSIQRTGDQVRLTVNLVDARTLRQLGSREIDLSRQDLAGMEDHLLDLVTELLDLQLRPQARSQVNTGKTTVSDAYDAYLQGRGYLRRYDKEGNLQLAIMAFKEALARDSHYAIAYAGLGEAYWRTFDRTKSPEWLELAKDADARAIELNERLAPAHVNLGMTYVSAGRYDAAVQEFQRALQLDSLNPDAYRELASAYEAMNNIKQAEETYKRAIQLRPNDWLSNSQLGVFYYRHGNYEAAEPYFRKIIALTPDNANGYSNLGALYVALRRYPEAENLLKKAIEVKPTDARGYSNLGTLYFQRGRYSDAVPMFEQAVNRSPGPNYTMFGNLADAYRWAPGLEARAAPAYERAIELAEQQLAINPKNASVLSSAAVYRAKLGQKARALQEITLAQSLAPRDTTIAFKAIIVDELLGRRAEAIAAVADLAKHSRVLEQVEAEPELTKLREDPAFIALASKESANADNTKSK